MLSCYSSALCILLMISGNVHGQTNEAFLLNDIALTAGENDSTVPPNSVVILAQY